MEPLTLEFVEQTADFMMRLTKNQLDERMADLKKRQFNIVNTINVSITDKKNLEKRDYIYRMALIVIHCYESNQIELPMISDRFISEIVKDTLKNSKKRNDNIPEEERLENSLKEIRQPNYIIYLKNMVNTDLTYQSIFTQEESHSNYFLMTTIGLFYAKWIEKYA